jgi:outer membrane protein assembly factor BamA
LVFGATTDTRDDVFSPHKGTLSSLSDEISGAYQRSDFNYQLITFDIAKFFPVGDRITLGTHAQLGRTTGAIPTNRLFTFSDQQLRGYNTVYYGTDSNLFQVELRVPVTKDGKFTVAAFADDGATRIRGAAPTFDANGNFVANLSTYQYHADVGLGIRFDIPQLGLRTIRLDYARGSQGGHTSFGIGQSF